MIDKKKLYSVTISHMSIFFKTKNVGLLAATCLRFHIMNLINTVIVTLFSNDVSEFQCISHTHQ